MQRALEARLGIPVSLSVQTARAYRDWVFLAGRPLTAEGGRIDYRVTDLAQAVVDGEFDDHFVALTRRLPSPRVAWRVVELALGATDAPFVAWFEHHGLPLGLASPEAGAAGR